jgi:hypothetical protein
MPPFSLTKGQESRTDGAPETPLNDERFRALYDTYLQQGYSVDDAAMAAEQAVAAASPDAQEARRREEAMRRSQVAKEESARIRYAEDLGMDFDAAQGMDLDEMRVRARFARSGDRRAQRDYARDQITTRAQYQDAGVPRAVSLLPRDERSDAIRQLLPRAPGGISDLEAAKLGLDRADLDARIQQGDRQFQAQMQQMRNEAERDRMAAEERRKQWEERFSQTERIADDERRDRRMARKDAKKSREAEREEKAADRTSREGQPAREAEAALGLDAGRRQSEMEAEERAEERTLANAQRDADVELYGAGVLAIMAGNYNTPAARESFKKIAAKSDETTGGFEGQSITNMDEELRRLNVSDPNVRRQIIQEYGIKGRTWFGGGSSASARPPVGWPQPQASLPAGWR